MAVSKGIEHAVKVDVAQFRVGQAPMRIMTMALGSCLGIVLYDPEARIGALAHAMHPRRERVKNNMNRAKFVDSVIPLLLERMLQWGARREKIVAKIFGGARMFDGFEGCRGILQIGDENIVAAREVLERARDSHRRRMRRGTDRADDRSRRFGRERSRPAHE